MIFKFIKNNIYRILLIFLFFLNIELLARSFIQEAKYAFSLGNYDKAFGLFNKTIIADPKNGEALFYMAYIREQQNNKEEAIPLYEKAIKNRIDKDLKEKAYWKITLYYKEIGDWENVLKYSSEFLKFNQHTNIKKLHEIALQKYNPKKNDLDTDDKYNEAMEELENGNKKGALKIFEEIVKKNNDNIDAHFQIVLLKMEVGNFKSAHKHLLILKELNPNNWQYHYKEGVCLYQLNEYDMAILSLKRAQELFPDKQDNQNSFIFYTNYMLGEIFIIKKKYKQALEYLENAAKIRNITSLDALISLNYWYLQKFNKVIEYAMKSNSSEPKQNLGLLTLSLAEWENKNEIEAIKWARALYTNSLKNKISNRNLVPYSLAFLILAEDSLKQQDWQNANKFYLKVEKADIITILQNNEFSNFHLLAKNFDFNFGLVNLNNGEPKNALIHLQNNLKKYGDNAKTYYLIAKSFAVLLDSEKTLIFLKKAILLQEDLYEKAKTDDAFVKLADQEQVFHNFLFKD